MLLLKPSSLRLQRRKQPLLLLAQTTLELNPAVKALHLQNSAA
jgi:hypothetical protein